MEVQTVANEVQLLQQNTDSQHERNEAESAEDVHESAQEYRKAGDPKFLAFPHPHLPNPLPIARLPMLVMACVRAAVAMRIREHREFLEIDCSFLIAAHRQLVQNQNWKSDLELQDTDRTNRLKELQG